MVVWCSLNPGLCWMAGVSWTSYARLSGSAATAVAAVIVSRSSDGSKASADALLVCGTRETRRDVHLLPWLTLHWLGWVTFRRAEQLHCHRLRLRTSPLLCCRCLTCQPFGPPVKRIQKIFRFLPISPCIWEFSHRHKCSLSQGE